MATVTKTLNANYTVNTNLLFSAPELVVNYLVDIPLRGLNGELLTDRTVEEKVLIAQEQIGNFLSIKFAKQKISEMQDFERDHFYMWGGIKLNYLVQEIIKLMGKLNFSRQIEYPGSWLSIRRALDVGRMLFIVPGQQEESGKGLTEDFVAVFTGKFPIFGYSSTDWIPNYWNIQYITGFDQVPKDLQNVVAKVATIQLLAILGDITFGAGIASKSVSIDGLSQSIGTTQSAENSLYSARIRQYQKELETEWKWLKQAYAGFPSVSM